MDNSSITLVQWKKRVLLVKAIYSQLLKQEPTIIAKKKFFDFFANVDADFIQAFEYCLDHQTNIVALINKNLPSSWTFARLNYVSQAILLATYSEAQVKPQDKSILIDQAIITAKNYCDHKDYEYINAVLDKIL